MTNEYESQLITIITSFTHQNKTQDNCECILSHTNCLDGQKIILLNFFMEDSVDSIGI